MTIIGLDTRKSNDKIQQMVIDCLESSYFVVPLDDLHTKKTAIPLKTQITRKKDRVLEWLSNYQFNRIVIVLLHYASLPGNKHPHCERNINSQNRLREDYTAYLTCIIRMVNVGHYNQNSLEDILGFGVLNATTPRRCYDIATISRINDHVA
jgi:hypothetical protein